MAKQSVNPVDIALQAIDEDIAILQRSRAILERAVQSVTDAPEPKAKRTRGKGKPKGLPETIVETMVKNPPKF